jgi:hypothetical protein
MFNDVVIVCFLQEAFKAFHKDLNHVKKFLKPIHLGDLDQKSKCNDQAKSLKEDFEELRNTAKKMVFI